MDSIELRKLSDDGLADVLQTSWTLTRLREQLASAEAHRRHADEQLHRLKDAAADFMGACLGYWFQSVREHHDPDIARTFAALEVMVNEVSVSEAK